jgi:RNA polymerase sigma factor (sigma-70 family)
VSVPFDLVPCLTAVPEAQPGLDAAEAGAFADFWNRHRDAARRRCLFLMKGRPEDADEALSRVALSALRHYLSDPGLLLNERAWVLRLAANACFDLYREQKRRRETSLEALAAPPAAPAALAWESPEQACLEGELRCYLRACIRGLPLRLRESAWLRLMEEWSYPDIARALSITQDNARKRVQEARSILRLAIGAYRRGAVDAMARSLHTRRARAV